MKSILIKTNLLIIILLFSISCSGEGNKKYTLALKLAKGETYKQHFAGDVDLTQEAMGQKMHILTQMNLKWHYSVTDQQGDRVNLQLVYDEVKMDMDMGTAKVSFDSNTSEDVASIENMGPLFKAIIGLPIELQLTKDKLTSVTGFENLQKAMVGAIDPNLGEQVKQQFLAMGNQQFSEESIKSLFEQFGSYLPDKPVGIGDAWDVETTINNNGINLFNQLKVTLKKVEGTVATLDVTGTVQTQEGGATQNMQGMEAKIEMKGEQSGTVLIDMNTGWAISTEITQNITGETKVMGMSIPQVLINHITITAE